ncbi:MAG: AAA family ATPase, partial [Hyphomicrobiales bacterium]
AMLQMFRKRTTAQQPVLLLVSHDAGTVESLQFYLGQQKFAPFQVAHVQPDGAPGHLKGKARADLIAVELESTGEADLAALKRVMEARDPATPVIVISPDVDETMVRLFLRLRVADWLRKPADPNDLVEACRRVDLTTGGGTGEQANCVTFMGAMGGVGATTLAVNTAVLLSERSARGKATTCLVDLDFTSGMCAEYLDLQPALQLDEVIPHPERLDDHLLGVMLSQYSPTLSLLSARARLGQYGDIDPSVVARLLDLAASRFANVVIDLPRAWQPWTETVLLGSGQFNVVTELTVPGLRAARRVVSELADREDGDAVAARVVVNKYVRRLLRTGISNSEVKEVLKDSFAGYVRANPALAREAIDRGVPMTRIKRRNKVVKDLARIVLPQK